MDSELKDKMLEARKGVHAENNPVKKYFTAKSEGKVTRALAIKAFCSQCMGCDVEWIEPGFRNEIRNCTSLKCALFSFRPFQTKD